MNLRLEDLPLPLVNETLRVGARLTSFVQHMQNLLGNCRASRTLGNGVQLEWESLNSTHQNTHLIQHQEYAQGLADGSGQALVQRGNRGSVPSRNQGFFQPSLPGAEKDRIYVLS